MKKELQLNNIQSTLLNAVVNEIGLIVSTSDEFSPIGIITPRSNGRIGVRIGLGIGTCHTRNITIFSSMSSCAGKR